MITNETLNAMYADDRHATITWRNNLHSDREDLEQAYTESNTPAETIDRAAAIMGIDRVREIVASLINIRADYDGRISADAKAWAQTIPGALDAAAAERVRLYSDAIHPAHLDQLARACKDYTPADPEPETTETTASPETETAPAAEPETETAEQTTETTQDAERNARITDITKQRTDKLMIKLMRDIINAHNAREGWDRGIKIYACELLDSLAECVEWAHRSGEPSPLESRGTVRAALLNGAEDWKQYSRGGCSLIYNGDIAERLCSPSELKRKRGGELPPNAAENWLDVQARALYQASIKALHAYDLALDALREGARA